MDLVPLGSAAVRLHLLSALCASGCLVLLWCSLGAFTKTAGLPARCARLAGVLLLATTPVFWAAARATEVYMLLALFMSVGFYFIVRAWGSRPIAGRIVWFIVGLALVHHYVILPVALWVMFRCRKRGFFLLFLPLVLIVVPMVRSQAGVALDWYHPGSFEGLTRLLLGGEFLGNLATGWERFSIAPSTVLFQDTFRLLAQWGLFFPVLFVGGWQLMLWSRRHAVEYGLVLLVYAGFYVFYLVGDRDVFSLPFLVLSTPILCLGLEWIAAQLTPRMHAHGPILLSLLLLLVPCWRAFDVSAARTGGDEAFRYSADVLRVLPPNAVLLAGLNESAQDNEIFPLAYQQIVERRRPDVDIIGTGFLALPWYREELVRRGLRLRLRELPLGKYTTDQEWYEDVWTGIVLEMVRDRPICSTVSPAYVAQRRGVLSWESCESRLLLRARAHSSPYLPWGTVFLLLPEG